jgi:hypothetical protein
MITQDYFIEFFNINRNRAAHLIYNASKLLGSEGKTWNYSLHDEAIAFHFSHLSDLRCFEQRIKELGLDAQIERPEVLVGKVVAREESAPPAFSTDCNTITNSTSTILEDTKSDGFDWLKWYDDTAYHEAAHVVIAYWFGWWVNDKGVWIDAYGGYAGLSYQMDNHVEQEHHCIDLAGQAAEMHLASDRANPRTNQYLIDTLKISHDPDGAEIDDGRVLARLTAAHPNEDDGQIIARYRALEQQTLELVRQEHIWSAIEIIAEELLRRKHLSRSEVEDLLPDGIQWGGRLAAARIAAASSNPWTNP